MWSVSKASTRRALVRKLRVKGAMTGVISTIDLDDASLIAKAQKSPDPYGRHLVKEVMPEQPATGPQLCTRSRFHLSPLPEKVKRGKVPHVVAIDYGMKLEHPTPFEGNGLPRHGRPRDIHGGSSAGPNGRCVPLQRSPAILAR